MSRVASRVTSPSNPSIAAGDTTHTSPAPPLDPPIDPSPSSASFNPGVRTMMSSGSSSTWAARYPGCAEPRMLPRIARAPAAETSPSPPCPPSAPPERSTSAPGSRRVLPSNECTSTRPPSATPDPPAAETTLPLSSRVESVLVIVTLPALPRPASARTSPAFTTPGACTVTEPAVPRDGPVTLASIKPSFEIAPAPATTLTEPAPFPFSRPLLPASIVPVLRITTESASPAPRLVSPGFFPSRLACLKASPCASSVRPSMRAVICPSFSRISTSLPAASVTMPPSATIRPWFSIIEPTSITDRASINPSEVIPPVTFVKRSMPRMKSALESSPATACSDPTLTTLFLPKTTPARLTRYTRPFASSVPSIRVDAGPWIRFSTRDAASGWMNRTVSPGAMSKLLKLMIAVRPVVIVVSPASRRKCALPLTTFSPSGPATAHSPPNASPAASASASVARRRNAGSTRAGRARSGATGTSIK